MIRYPYSCVVSEPSQLEFIEWNGCSEIWRLKERRLSEASPNLIFATFRVVWGKTPVLANWRVSVCGRSKNSGTLFENAARLSSLTLHTVAVSAVRPLSGQAKSNTCRKQSDARSLINLLEQSVSKGDYTPNCAGKKPPEGPAS